jgi:hypothetical protein
MCDEPSPFVVLTLVIRRSKGLSSPDVDFPLYWRRLETWLASSPHCIVNQLKRLRLKLVTNYGAHLYFTFAISPKGDLMLDECRFPPIGSGEGGWLSNKPVEAAVVAALKTRVQKVMIQKATKGIRRMAENGTEFEFSLLRNRNDNLTFTTCRHRREIKKWDALDAETLAELQTIVQQLNRHRTTFIRSGVRLFQAIVACQSVWKRLLDENLDYDPDDNESDVYGDPNYFDDYDSDDSDSW